MNKAFSYIIILSFLSCLSIYASSKLERENAKLIEDYYFQYKKSNLKKALKTQKRISGKSILYKDLRLTFREGKRVARKITSGKACSVKNPKEKSYVEKKFYRAFEKACFKHMTKTIIKSRSSRLSNQEIVFLKENEKFFLSSKNSKAFKKRYQLLKKKHKRIISSNLKRYILNHKKLPHQNAMSYLKIDEELTSFIQANKLFDQKDKKYYQNTFNNLLSNMKNKFISGDSEELEEGFDSLKSFYTNNQNNINDEKIWKNVLKNGKKLINNENYADAIEFIKTASTYIAEDDLNESIFQVIFTKYLKNDVYEARKYIKEKKLVENFKKLDSRLMYWTAFIFDLNKDLILAKSLYKKTVENHPLSFYSILSLKRLQFFSPVNFKETLINQNQSIASRRHLTKKVKKTEKILSLYKKVGRTTLAGFYATELRNIPVKKFFKKNSSVSITNESKVNYLISFFSKKSLYLDSFKTAYQGVDSKTLKLSPNIIRSLFPKSFSRYVKSSNKKLDYRIVRRRGADLPLFDRVRLMFWLGADSTLSALRPRRTR